MYSLPNSELDLCNFFEDIFDTLIPLCDIFCRSVRQWWVEFDFYRQNCTKICLNWNFLDQKTLKRLEKSRNPTVNESKVQNEKKKRLISLWRPWARGFSPFYKANYDTWCALTWNECLILCANKIRLSEQTLRSSNDHAYLYFKTTITTGHGYSSVLCEEEEKKKQKTKKKQQNEWTK